MLPPLLSLLQPLDYVAMAFLLAGWWLTGWRVERTRGKPSVTVLMMQHNRDWMAQMLTRQPRIFDAQVLSAIRQSTAFFASTCVIAIGGALALMGNADNLQSVAEGFGERDLPPVLWQVKLAPVAALLTAAFLKFVWSNRLFGYSAVVMAGVPNDPNDPEAPDRARQAAELNIRAAWNFNRGLRAMYYALGALGWLLGPVALLGTAALTHWIVWSREFRSRPRDILLGKL